MVEIAFPNTASNNQIFIFQPDVGEPRFWRYYASQNYWSALRSYVRTYTRYGTLTTNTGTLNYNFGNNITITDLSASVVSGPVGNTLVITVNKNGTAVTNLTINAGSTSTNGINFYSNLEAFVCTTNDNITIDITNNAGTPANTLFVRLRYINN